MPDVLYFILFPRILRHCYAHAKSANQQSNRQLHPFASHISLILPAGIFCPHLAGANPEVLGKFRA